MKIITNKEVESLTINTRFGRRKSNLIEECSKLEKEEMLFVSIEEWKSFGYKNSIIPPTLLGSASYQNRKGHHSLTRGMKFKTKKYREGWVIKRID